ncbi:hypothetical protein PBY51_013556 [Eleginops maclovinus]|uniref:Uncharacterized protein n=1 Tax=Eleginops maclovinus TaxID=56733 RepID=A0AAN7XZH4_ELEMC|nr:hypothetical protein PBY51_013556 [Eleginops maclovinus]
MKSAQRALQRGSTVKPQRGSGAVVTEPEAVITAALEQHCTSGMEGGGQPHGMQNIRGGEEEIENNAKRIWKKPGPNVCIN